MRTLAAVSRELCAVLPCHSCTCFVAATHICLPGVHRALAPHPKCTNAAARLHDFVTGVTLHITHAKYISALPNASPQRAPPAERPAGSTTHFERDHVMKVYTGLATFNADELAKVAARPAAGLDALMRSLADGLANWNGRQIEITALRRMDDRLLEDIGLTRADLDRAA